MDIVYPYKKGSDELIYSLRSLTNLPHDKVFIVGDKPEDVNLKTVNYIQFSQNKTKYKNTTDILRMICEDKNLSDDFILMNDDFFILKPIKNPEEELNLCRGYSLKVYEHYVQKYGENGYSKGMLETTKILQDMGIKEPLCYEIHTPFVFNKNKFLAMFEHKGVDNIQALHKRSLYGNLYKRNSISIKDVKVFAFGNNIIEEGQKFLSCSDTAWPNVRVKLEQIFKLKSIYEV